MTAGAACVQGAAGDKQVQELGGPPESLVTKSLGCCQSNIHRRSSNP